MVYINLTKLTVISQNSRYKPNVSEWQYSQNFKYIHLIPWRFVPFTSWFIIPYSSQIYSSTERLHRVGVAMSPSYVAVVIHHIVRKILETSWRVSLSSILSSILSETGIQYADTILSIHKIRTTRQEGDLLLLDDYYFSAIVIFNGVTVLALAMLVSRLEIPTHHFT